MAKPENIEEFVRKCGDLIADIESAIKQESDMGLVSNYELALNNVKSWREAAANGTLLPSNGMKNFGVSKADLIFGVIEDKLYAVERYYVENM